jgi:hypothetical protein
LGILDLWGQSKVARIDQYFLTFYLIDIDMAIALVLFLTARRFVLSIFVQQSVDYYPPNARPILWGAALIFLLDGLSLRREVTDMPSKNSRRSEKFPHDAVYCTPKAL